MITGVAISPPLMGVGVVGAWEWFTGQDARPKSQASLVRQSAVLGAGAAAGRRVFCERFRRHCAAAGIEKTIRRGGNHRTQNQRPRGRRRICADRQRSIFHSGNTSDGASLSSLGFAAIDLSWLYNALMVPIAMVAFFIVFLASNAINILILLSPFGVVDAALSKRRARRSSRASP